MPVSLVDVVIRVKYTPQKAARLTSNEVASHVVRKDLAELGFPYPKVVNCYKESEDMVLGFWPDLNYGRAATGAGVLASIKKRLVDLTQEEKAAQSIVMIKASVVASSKATHRRPRTRASPIPDRREAAPVPPPRTRSASPPPRPAPTSVNSFPAPFGPYTIIRNAGHEETPTRPRIVTIDRRLPHAAEPTPSGTSTIIRRVGHEEEPLRRSIRIKQNEHIQNLDKSLAALRRLSSTIAGTEPQATTSVLPLAPSQPPAALPAAVPSAPRAAASAANAIPRTVEGRSQAAEIARLTRELWDTRRQATAANARSMVLVEELAKLGASKLPQVRVAAEDLNRNDVAAIEATLREEIRLRKLSEARLLEEQARREDAERALRDVERECREPFIVPALLRAFMDISKLSDESMTKGLSP